MIDSSEELPLQDSWDGMQLLMAFRGASNWLEQHVARINALNVFPVPDGDTGTNMNLTLAAAVKNVTPQLSCADVTRQVSTGAMYGARGNSGVILSQILRGIANGLAGQERCGPAELAAALAEGSRTAYRGASEPREGTILTVSREAAEAAQQRLAHPATVEDILAAALEGAQASVVRTPELLDVLRKAGVVDAGGEGYRTILEGMLRAIRGESLELEAGEAPVDQVALLTDDVGHVGFGFCTNVLLSGDHLPFDEIREHMRSVGESVVVVGDESLIRIHVHTPRPGDILNYLGDHGTIAQVEIANMDIQREALKAQQDAETTETKLAAVVYPPEPEHRATFGTVVVAPGKGWVDLFISMNADAVVLGGQTMNPSTQDILEAIDATPQDQVVVLPNNGNVIRSAEEARQLTNKQVFVVPTRTLPQGVAALLGRQYHLPFDEYAAAVTHASSDVVTIEITTAVREAEFDGLHVHIGQTIALLNGKLSAAGDDQETVIDDVLERAGTEERDVLTIYYGESVSAERAAALGARLQERYPDQEVEVQLGGQPHYDYIVGIE